jgi:hypothetical protein
VPLKWKTREQGSEALGRCLGLLLCHADCLRVAFGLDHSNRCLIQCWRFKASKYSSVRRCFSSQTIVAIVSDSMRLPQRWPFALAIPTQADLATGSPRAEACCSHCSPTWRALTRFDANSRVTRAVSSSAVNGIVRIDSGFMVMMLSAATLPENAEMYKICAFGLSIRS